MVMPDNQNPDGIVNDTEKKMIRETLQINAADIPFTNGGRLRSSSRREQRGFQLVVKLVCKHLRCSVFVVPHDRLDVGVDARME